MKKEDNQRKGAQMEDFSLNDELQSLDTKDLYDLVKDLTENNSEVRRLVLEWLKENAKKDVVFLNDELLIEYWGNAEEIISEFNAYGGGSEEEEDEAYDWLNRISELVEEGDISTDAKFDFLDEAFVEYNKENSGFEDALMDIFFKICQTKEEWECLVKKLEEHPSDWRKKLIIDIQKNYLRNDKAYLKERMENLRYGMDYWDLLSFYIDRGNLQKALETAEQGILKGEGRLTELLQFLFDHFAKAKDSTNLERIVHTALARNTEEKEMLDRLFEYYKSQKNYEKAKETLLKSYEFIKHEDYYKNYYAEYKRMKEFLKDSEWKLIEPKIFEDAQENIHDYLRICLDKNMKKTVLYTILNPPKNQWGFVIENGFDEFADKLKEDFPERIIEYYWKKAYSNIPGGNRKTYRNAAKYLAEVKHIYIEILKEESRWIQRFFDLKVEFKNRPAFLDEVRKL